MECDGFRARFAVGTGIGLSSGRMDVFRLGSAQLDSDLDGDGIEDVFDLDNDGDGLMDRHEIELLHTNANNADSEGDGMPDGWEVDQGLAPLDAADADKDKDGDGLSNLQEFMQGSDPDHYGIIFHPGWNLVSIARAPVDYSASAILNGIVCGPCWTFSDDQYLEVQDLYPLAGTWVFSHMEESIEVNFDALEFPPDDDADGDGLSESQELTRGTDPEEYYITLTAGWNLVSLSRVPEDNSVQAIFGDAVVSKAWVWEDGCYHATDRLLPWRGHWLYAKSACTVPIVWP